MHPEHAMYGRNESDTQHLLQTRIGACEVGTGLVLATSPGPRSAELLTLSTPDQTAFSLFFLGFSGGS